jgi:hypothetical protein
MTGIVARGKCTIVFAFLLMVFTVSPAQMIFRTGNDLVTYKREYEKLSAGGLTGVLGAIVSEAGMYVGYIIGVHDATMWNYSINDRITVGQVVEVFSNYLKENPEEWAEPAAFLVLKMLKKAFPATETR